MRFNQKRRVDTFTFSLGGISVASSYAAIPVLSNDRIARAWDERLTAEKGLTLNPPQLAELSPECG